MYFDILSIHFLYHNILYVIAKQESKGSTSIKIKGFETVVQSNRGLNKKCKSTMKTTRVFAKFNKIDNKPLFSIEYII